MHRSLFVIVPALVGLLAACGGSFGEPPPVNVGNVSGYWLFYRTHGGIEEPAEHVLLIQSDSVVTFQFSCADDLPLGRGAYADGRLSVGFEEGGANVLSLWGANIDYYLAGSYASAAENGTWRMVRTSDEPDCRVACDPVTVERFVDTDFVNLSQVEEISRFRSAAGHAYVDGCETCRSMKHYYAPFPAFRDNDLIDIHSPVTGVITSVLDEGHGSSVGLTNKQVHIRSVLHPTYTFVLFHVDLASVDIAPGETVSKGEVIGTARMYYPDLTEFAHDFDIAVQLDAPGRSRYVSFFDVMTDGLFADYQARGVAARSDLVITESERDADPLTCDDDTFTSTGTLDSWFVLDP